MSIFKIAKKMISSIRRQSLAKRLVSKVENNNISTAIKVLKENSNVNFMKDAEFDICCDQVDQQFRYILILPYSVDNLIYKYRKIAIIVPSGIGINNELFLNQVALIFLSLGAYVLSFQNLIQQISISNVIEYDLLIMTSMTSEIMPRFRLVRLGKILAPQGFIPSTKADTDTILTDFSLVFKKIKVDKINYQFTAKLLAPKDQYSKFQNLYTPKLG